MSVWEMAQRAELGYWEAQNLKAIGRQLSFVLRNFFGLPPNIFKDQTVLEIGTGPVGFVSMIEARRKYGIEPLRAKFEEIFPAIPGVEWVGEKGEEIKLREKSVDTVLCFNVIPSHVDDVDKCLSEIRRVLVKSGTFVFGMKDDQKDQYHKHIYGRKQMQAKLEQYFRVLKVIDKYRMWGALCRPLPMDEPIEIEVDSLTASEEQELSSTAEGEVIATGGMPT